MSKIETKEKWNIAKEVLENSLKGTPYKEYLKPVPIKENDINKIYRDMLFHAQNSWQKRNIIRFLDYEDNYKRALFNFDPKQVCLKTTYEIKELLEKNVPVYKMDINKTKERYIRTIKESAEFLNKFDDANSFIDHCKLIIGEKDKYKGKYALSKEIQDIHGIGLALSLDFLKEIGFECYAKPDVHLKDFISEIFGCKNKDKEILKKIDEITSLTGETQYAIDKLIYLACTHNFYLDRRNRHELIKEIKNKIK